MNILYLIATFKHSRGGHYYSLRTISDAMSAHVNTIVFNIGLKENKILQSDLFSTIHVKFNGINYINVVRTILRQLGKNKPNVIHSFDNNTLAIARILSRIYRIPIIYTKCGGPNPKRLFSFVKYMIVFQRENEEYIKRLPESKYLCLLLMPNRVGKIVDDIERIKKLTPRLGERTIFLRIARIGECHELSIEQSINLIKKLYDDGFPVRLLIIGYIEDLQIYTKLKALGSDEYVTFITEDYFTLNGNSLIDIADFVIGTGRGLMEAASKSKILLTSIRDEKIPVLVTRDNFYNLFYYNFSNRSHLDDYSDENNYSSIKEILKDNEKAQKQKQFSFECYQKYFSVQTIVPDYLKLYSEARFESKFHVLGFLKSIYLASKVYFYWKNQLDADVE